MADVTNAQELLIDALQDLRAAEVALGERLPGITAKVSDDVLGRGLADYATHGEAVAGPMAEAIERLGGEAEGAPNIWMNAVLDDAQRDTKTVESGRWLDVALLGALRKGAQAARVSYETAIALADAMSDAELRQMVTGLRDYHAAFDDQLAAMLGLLTGTAD